MKACATLDSIVTAQAGPVMTPMVLVDSEAESRLSVARMVVRSPLDERTVELEAQADIAERDELARRWKRALHVAAALPLRLVDDQVRWQVLARGRLREVKSDRLNARDELRFELVDAWSAALARAMERVWRESPSGVRVDSSGARVLRVGSGMNRSLSTHEVNGREVHVPALSGDLWTVRTTLETVSAFANLDLSLRLLEEDIADSPLLGDVDLSRPIGDVLRRIMEPYGLVVQRELWRRGGRVLERRAARSAERGRVVRVPWPNERRKAAVSLRIEKEHPI